MDEKPALTIMMVIYACALQILISIRHQRFSMVLIKPSEVVKMKYFSCRYDVEHVGPVIVVRCNKLFERFSQGINCQ